MTEDWTPMIAVGKGVGAGIRGGMAYIVAGSLFAQIERERSDGPRYVEAVAGSRALRRDWFDRYGVGHDPRWANYRASIDWLRALGTGIPEGWIAR